jgi:hypothetical protein
LFQLYSLDAPKHTSTRLKSNSAEMANIFIVYSIVTGLLVRNIESTVEVQIFSIRHYINP